MAEINKSGNKHNPRNNILSSSGWRLWCRLCAKNDPEGNINVFFKNEQAVPGDWDSNEMVAPISNLTIAIGKYFYINITRGEELPEMICSECLALVTSLVNFSERITRVQELYCLLQRTPSESVNIHELRGRFGLLEDEPETFTEEHYVEEKPKLNELEETTLELENPLTPYPNYIGQESEKCDDIKINRTDETVTEDQEDRNYDDAEHDPHRNERDVYNNDNSTTKSMYPCSECSRVYASSKTLQRHIRHVHDNVHKLRPRFDVLEDKPETLTEVHYIEEKLKINEFEETVQELENPLSPYSNELSQKSKKPHENFILNTKEEVVAKQDKEKEQHGDARNELLFNECDIYNNDGSTASSAIVLKGDKQKQSKTKTVKPSSKSMYPCSGCSRVYASIKTLQRHVRQDHNSSETNTNWPCKECEKSFQSRFKLQRHAQRHLPKTRRKMFPCTKCGKEFTTNASAQSHDQNMHQEERPRPVICEQCGIAVRSLNALNKHMLSHTDYAPYECEVCKKCFKSVTKLKLHKETHDPHKYICPECGIQLNSRETFNRHRLVHIDKMQHKCDYCDREFKRAKALKNHLILHTGLKPYSCDFCERTFANGSNCRAHKKKSHPQELAAQETTDVGKTYNRNIPKLEALKAFTKNKDNLSPVATKQSGCFAFGKKAKKSLRPDATPDVMPSSAPVATIDNIYNI